jgi:Ca-activated chloride channel homolog
VARSRLIGAALAGAFVVATPLLIKPCAALETPTDAAAASAESRPFTETVVVHRIRWPALVAPRHRHNHEERAICERAAPGDFQVFEENRAVQVESVDRDEGPSLFALLVDVSPSMSEHIEAVKSAAAGFVDTLDPDTPVMLATFEMDLAVRIDPTNDHGKVIQAIRSLDIKGRSTSIYDTIYDLLDRLDTRPERKVIILLSDGADTSSTRHTAAETLARAARSRDLRVFTLITVTHEDLRATAPMRSLAVATAGHFEMADGERELASSFRAIRRRLAQEVVLTYVAPPSATETAERRVRVTIRARPGLPCKVREAQPERVLIAAAVSP